MTESERPAALWAEEVGQSIANHRQMMERGDELESLYAEVVRLSAYCRPVVGTGSGSRQ